MASREPSVSINVSGVISSLGGAKYIDQVLKNLRIDGCTLPAILKAQERGRISMDMWLAFERLARAQGRRLTLSEFLIWEKAA